MGEVCRLKISDIDSDRMTVRVIKSKGKTDRYVPLSNYALTGLRKYIKSIKPKTYLFNGKVKGEPLGKGAVQQAFRLAVKKAGIIKQFSSDPKHLGAETAMTSILHTWGQNLSLHPHLHCIVPGGGITPSNHWKEGKSNGKYLFPTKALANVFRAKFMSVLRSSGIKVDQSIAKRVFQKQWVVYAKKPFFEPEQVVEYLGRYTHKIAISNHRIQSIDPYGNISFAWKDYRKGGKKGVMKLSAHEFLRRFSQHILPSGFVRIRHYGVLASRNKSVKLNLARTFYGMEKWQKPEKVNWEKVAQERMDFIPHQCPKCKEGVMKVIAVIEPQRGPPVNIPNLKTPYNV